MRVFTRCSAAEHQAQDFRYPKRFPLTVIDGTTLIRIVSVTMSKLSILKATQSHTQSSSSSAILNPDSGPTDCETLFAGCSKPLSKAAVFDLYRKFDASRNQGIVECFSGGAATFKIVARLANYDAI